MLWFRKKLKAKSQNAPPHKPIDRKLVKQELALIDWYTANLRNTLSNSDEETVEIFEALKHISSNAAATHHLKLILSTLETRSIQSYAEKFSIPPGTYTSDVSLVRASLFRLKALLRGLIDDETGHPDPPPNYQLGRMHKPRPPRPTSVSNFKIIGPDWEAKRTSNGARLEFEKSAHGGDTKVVDLTKAEFEELRRGEGPYARLYTADMRQQHFGET